MLLSTILADHASAQHSEDIIEQVAEQHKMSGDEVRKGLTESITNILEQNASNPAVLNTFEGHYLGLNKNQVITDDRQKAVSDQAGDNNEAMIEQVGNQNVAGISQHGVRNIAIIDQNGFENFGSVHQSGIQNSARMQITGAYNQISVNQRGDHNLFDLELNGNDNYLDLTQQGSYNIYERRVDGNAVLNETVLQIGDGNISTQIGTLSNGRSANIIQEGSGMEVSIRHD